jgi:hypothetical protein
MKEAPAEVDQPGLPTKGVTAGTITATDIAQPQRLSRPMTWGMANELGNSCESTGAAARATFAPAANSVLGSEAVRNTLRYSSC